MSSTNDETVLAALLKVLIASDVVSIEVLKSYIDIVEANHGHQGWDSFLKELEK